MTAIERGFVARLQRSVAPVQLMHITLYADPFSFDKLLTAIWLTDENHAMAMLVKVDFKTVYKKKSVSRFMRKTRKRILRTTRKAA